MIGNSRSQTHLVWGQDLNSNCRIKKLQKTAIRLMSFSKPTDHTEPLFRGLSIQTINETVFQHNILLVYKTLNKITPVAIQNALKLFYLLQHLQVLFQTGC